MHQGTQKRGETNRGRGESHKNEKQEDAQQNSNTGKNNRVVRESTFGNIRLLVLKSFKTGEERETRGRREKKKIPKKKGG